MLALLLPVAFAAEPSISVMSNNTIVGEIVLDVPLSTAEEIIADPVRMSIIDGTTEVTEESSKGRCKQLLYRVPNAVAPISYQAQACPNPEGWIYTLISSEQLSDYHSAWSAVREGDRTRIRYEIRTIPSIPVPQFVVNRQSKSAVHGFLTRLSNYLE